MGSEQGVAQAQPRGSGLEPCSAPPAMQLVEGAVRSIQADDEAVYYIAADEGTGLFLTTNSGPGGAIKRTSFATGETTTLYTPPPGNLLSQLHLSGDELFIYKRSVAPMTPEGGFVFRMPKQGGEPELLGPLNLDPGFTSEASRGGILGVVGGELIVSEGHDDGVSALSLADGGRRVLLSAAQGNQTTSMHLAEGRLWYSDENGFGAVLYRDVASADAQPLVLHEAGCTEGLRLSIGRIWFRAAASGIYCGGAADIPRLSLDGMERAVAWDVPANRRYAPVNPLQVEGQTLYLGSDRHGVRVQLDTGEASIFACGGVGVDAFVTTRERIVWAGGDATGILLGEQLRFIEYDGIFVLPK